MENARKKVMVFGTFDVLHEGHIDFFRQARSHGDFLIAVIARDSTTEQIGKKIIQDENQRLKNVKNHVDLAVLGSVDDKYKIIRELNPDVICLGYDQWAKEKDVRSELDKVGLKNTQIVRLRPYEEARAKSSIAKQKSVDF